MKPIRRKYSIPSFRNTYQHIMEMGMEKIRRMTWDSPLRCNFIGHKWKYKLLQLPIEKKCSHCGLKYYLDLFTMKWVGSKLRCKFRI